MQVLHLEPKDYLSILVAGITLLGAFIIAYLHRKQMRQNEAFRVNPDVGLLPPSSPVWTFVKRNWVALLPGASLLYELFSNEPITRFHIVLISLNVGLLVLTALNYFVDKILGLIRDIIRLQAETIGTAKAHIQVNREVLRAMKPPPAPGTLEGEKRNV